MVAYANADYLRAKAVWPRAVVLIRTSEGFRSFAKGYPKEKPAHMIIDGRPYWGDYRTGISTKHKDAASYCAWVDKEIRESREGRGAK